MLSPANHHLHVPRGLTANLRYRKWVLDRCAADPAEQAAVRQMCSEDIIYWFDVFCFQHNPTINGPQAVGPLILSRRQEDLLLARPETHAHLEPYDRGVLWCVENLKTMAVEKSRWQGATWLFLGLMVWDCGFHQYRNWPCISRNAEAVDDGTPDCLYWKMEHILAHQPTWLMGEVNRTKMRLSFTRTKSYIPGEATTTKAGVSGRGSGMFVDEFAELEDMGDVIRDKTALTTHVRFFVGTHLGSGTPFDRMCDPDLSPEIVKQQLHWTDGLPEQTAGMYEYDPARPTQPIIHDTAYQFPPDFKFVLDGTPTGGPRPGVRSPWYDRKGREMSDSRAVAQNLDIDIHGSAKMFFDSARLGHLLADCRPPVWEGEVTCDRRGENFALHEAKGGRLRLWVKPDGCGRLPEARYTGGSDVSLGTGATNSCFTAIDGDRSLVVLEWADPRTEIRDFASLCVGLCRWLYNALFAWDARGGVGSKFGQEVLAIGYGNIYYDGETEIRHPSARGQPRNPGWSGSDKQVLDTLIDYRTALYERKLADRSERAIKECLKFEYDRKTLKVRHSGEKRSNDPTGAGVNHGDLAQSRVIAWMLAKEMAVGGRQARVGVKSGPEPYTQEWMDSLVELQRRRKEERW